MKVEEFIKCVRNIEDLLRTFSRSSDARDLAEMAAALQTFEGQTIKQFAAFLKQAEEFQRTGKVTTTGRRAAAPKVDEEKVKQLAQRVLQLQERAIDATVDYEDIERELKQLEKKINKDEALLLAKEVNIKLSKKTKKEAFAQIQRRIFERKASYQQTSF